MCRCSAHPSQPTSQASERDPTALSAFGAVADPGHGGHDRTPETAYGRPGDPVTGVRIVDVVMTETDNGMAFAPDRIEVRWDEPDHELVIGTVESNHQHEDPKASGEQRWQFTRAGTVAVR